MKSKLFSNVHANYAENVIVKFKFTFENGFD